MIKKVTPYLQIAEPVKEARARGYNGAILSTPASDIYIEVEDISKLIEALQEYEKQELERLKKVAS
jgi:hypothetical protein